MGNLERNLRSKKNRSINYKRDRKNKSNENSVLSQFLDEGGSVFHMGLHGTAKIVVKKRVMST